MEERIRNYRQSLEDAIKNEDLEKMQKLFPDILVQIQFFQHERLIHLIVTVTFAILSMMALQFFITTESIAVLVLFLLFMALLVPYIRHYYILENYTQRLYYLYDEIKEILNK